MLLSLFTLTLLTRNSDGFTTYHVCFIPPIYAIVLKRGRLGKPSINATLPSQPAYP
jgi:hypothetical protein